jgi:hypothetical protein
LIHGTLASYAAIIGLGVAAILIAIAVHEAGHVAAGLACGFRFALYVVGPSGSSALGHHG